MKTLLEGGPFDGRVIDVERTAFAVDILEVIHDKHTDEELGRKTVRYENVHRKVDHPCKKRGKTRVFAHVGPAPDEET